MGSRDHDAEIESVYRHRYGRFLRVAVAIVRDERVAEEAVHDAFVRALRHRAAVREHGALEAWLWRIVVNEARRRRAAEQRARVSPENTVGATSTSEDRDGVLDPMVAALPERQRLALFLRYYADLDYDAIATALGVKPGTVAASLHAAHAALRRQLLEVER